MHAMHFNCYEAKLPSLKLHTRPKQLLDYLPLDIVLPSLGWQCVPDSNALAYYYTKAAILTEKKFYKMRSCSRNLGCEMILAASDSEIGAHS